MMTIPLSSEVEKALADLRVAIENQLAVQSTLNEGGNDQTAAMFKTNDEVAFAAQESPEPAQPEVEVVLPVLGQTPAMDGAATAELPYPDVPDLSTPTPIEPVLPQPELAPHAAPSAAELGSASEDNPFLVPQYQEPPAGNNLPVDAPVPEEVVASPSFSEQAPSAEVTATTAPPPSRGSFAKARGLLSNVLQRGNQES